MSLRGLKIIFRADASQFIGTGHVMRCLTLADECAVYGAAIEFFCRNEPGHLAKLIQERGYRVHLFPVNQPFNQKQDAEECLKRLPTTIDLLVVDHYGLSAEWETALHSKAKQIFVVDDLADRPHECGFLLDPNFHPKPDQRYANLIPSSCRIFLGTEYALLRPQFRMARRNLKSRDGSIRSVLVSFGGSDVSNETGKTLRALEKFPQLHIDVIAGKNHPCASQLRQWCAEHKNTTFHSHVFDMASMMNKTDLAIGAGGSTTWERCFLGVPSLMTTIAKNQTELTEALAQKNIVNNLGWHENVTEADIQRAVQYLLDHPERVREMSERSLAVMGDGSGIRKLIMEILQPPLTLRPVRKEDSQLLFQWRNDPEVLQASFHPQPVSREEHMSWFEKKILSAKTRMFLAFDAQENPIGQIRFDMETRADAVLSISLAGTARGKGLGTEVIQQGCRRFFQETKACRIFAWIKPENTASKKSFLKAGFQLHKLVQRGRQPAEVYRYEK